MTAAQHPGDGPPSIPVGRPAVTPTTSTITSTKNSTVKALRRLHDRHHREEAGRFLIDGVRLVDAALQAGAGIEQIIVADPPPEWVAPLVAEASRRGIPVLPVAPHVLEAISQVDTPQGIAAVALIPAGAEPPLDRPDLLLLVVDRVRDPGNLGTMVRTADAVAASAIALVPGTVDPYSPKVARASMGSLFHVPLFEWEADRLRRTLREHGVRIIGTEVGAPLDFRVVEYRRPLAIVVGNEGEGLAPEWREAADVLVSIPIYGRAESLNAAVAAALVLYAATARADGGRASTESGP